MMNRFIVRRDSNFVDSFINEQEAHNFAASESLRNLESEYCIYENNDTTPVLVASYKQGQLIIREL